MSFWTAIVAIALIIGVCSVMMERSRNQRDRSEPQPDKGEAQLREERDAAQAELQDLRERVKVLERIATDPARRTAEEIEKLRDE